MRWAGSTGSMARKGSTSVFPYSVPPCSVPWHEAGNVPPETDVGALTSGSQDDSRERTASSAVRRSVREAGGACICMAVANDPAAGPPAPHGSLLRERQTQVERVIDVHRLPMRRGW